MFKNFTVNIFQVEEVIGKYKSSLLDQRYKFNMGSIMGNYCLSYS